VLKTVAWRAEKMAKEMSKYLPYPLVYKVTAVSNSQITDIVKEANYDDITARAEPEDIYGRIRKDKLCLQGVFETNCLLDLLL